MNRTAIVALAIGLAVGLAPAAHAKSSLTVVNNWTGDVDIWVFDGKDRSCQQQDAAQKKTVAVGESKAFSCQGKSTDRCRVTVLVPDTNNRYCGDIYHSCKQKARDVEDGGSITLSGTGTEPTCTVTGKDGSTKAESGAD